MITKMKKYLPEIFFFCSAVVFGITKFGMLADCETKIGARAIKQCQADAGLGLFVGFILLTIALILLYRRHFIKEL